jgi:bifunctional non-homologous end joining protein LigD
MPSDKDRIPFRVTPMLATLVRKPFHKPGWIYEEKYDGYRILAYKEGDRVTLVSRNGNDRTARYAPVAGAIQQLRPRTVLLDGEVVAFDGKGISRFQLLQEGSTATAYAVFDCLYSSGRDLRHEPLEIRRPAAESAIDKVEGLMISRRLASDGLEAFKTARKRGYEGLVAKDLSSPYIEGRSSKWLKVKVHQEEELVIGGFTKP